MQVNFRKRATNYMALLQTLTYKDKETTGGGFRHPVVRSRRDIAVVLSLSRERVSFLSKERALHERQNAMGWLRVL